MADRILDPNVSEDRDIICQGLSDLSKAAYGFRLRRDWGAMSSDELAREYEELTKAAEDAFASEAKQEAAAREAWEHCLTRYQQIGARDRATAIRWDMQAMGADDVEHYCYLLGIPYSEERAIRTEVGEVRHAH